MTAFELHKILEEGFSSGTINKTDEIIIYTGESFLSTKSAEGGDEKTFHINTV